MTYTDYTKQLLRMDIDKLLRSYKRLCQEEGVSKTLRDNKYFRTRTQKRKAKAKTSYKTPSVPVKKYT